jgi:hypothetical protein
LIERHIFGDSKFVKKKRKNRIIITFYLMDKVSPKITSPIKPLEISTMAREENEDIQNQLPILENQID